MIFTLQVPDRLNVNLIWPHVRFTGLLMLYALLGKGRAPEDVTLELIRVCLHYFMVWKRVLCEDPISLH